MRRCLGCRVLIPGGSRCPACSRPSSGIRYPAEYQRNRAIILANDPACHWCGIEHATTADHLTPISHGGGHDLGNLVPSCLRCNSSRGNRPIESMEKR